MPRAADAEPLPPQLAAISTLGAHAGASWRGAAVVKPMGSLQPGDRVALPGSQWEWAINSRAALPAFGAAPRFALCRLLVSWGPRFSGAIVALSEPLAERMMLSGAADFFFPFGHGAQRLESPATR